MTYPLTMESGLKLAEMVAPSTHADVAALAAVGAAGAAYLLRGIAWDKPDPYNYIWYEKPQAKDGQIITNKKEGRNIAEKLHELNKDIVIFWGSQSGTAEAFANRLARECRLRFGNAPLSADLSDYDAESIAQIPDSKLAIFIISTYGEGDPSDNTAELWDWLGKESSLNLSKLRYVAFGLGNSSYKFYNRVIDVVVEKLDAAGANRLLPVGKADDADGSTEETFMAWKDQLYTFFQQQLGFEEHEVPYQPSIAVVEDTSLDIIDLHRGEPVAHRSGPAKVKSTYSAIQALPVKESRELFDSADSRCFHMEIDLSQFAELRYRTGDHIAIYPNNPDQEVQLLLEVLGLKDRADVPVLINQLDDAVKINLPSPTSISSIFRHYLEVCATVSQDAIRELTAFAPTPESKAFLTELSSNMDNYHAYLEKGHITMGRLLAAAAPNTIWKDLPISWVLETIRTLQPRYYSISSSSTVSPRRVALTVGVEKGPASDNSSVTYPGLASNYLRFVSNSLNIIEKPLSLEAESRNFDLSGPSGALEGHKVYACLRKSTFKLPVLGSTPLIMIGAGTGIAPFRGFIQERARLKSVGKPVGKMFLFFGCRYPEKDELYREEFAEAAAELDGALEIVNAFSRADPNKRVYVQDRIAERGNEVCNLLDEGANLYICGRASMSRDVGKVVEDLMRARNNWGDEEIQAWTTSIKKGKKWSEDVWG